MKQVHGWVAILSLVWVLVVFGAAPGSAESNSESLGGLKHTAESANEFAQMLPAKIRSGLSGTVRNMIGIADRWDRIEGMLRDLADANDASGAPRSETGMTAESGSPQAVIVSTKPVSDPAKDFLKSRLGAFSQYQTSTARCGQNVVVGFNDAGSLLESYATSPRPGLTLAGVARSTDGGATFTDLGFLSPSADPADRIWGNAVVQCTNANTFYYVSIMSRNHDSGQDDDTRDIGISKSVDGGAVWGPAVSAAFKSAKTHVLDKPWLAVDPYNAKRLYIVYTDFDTEAQSGTATTCPAYTTRTAIELVRSTNAGATWSEPMAIAEVCADSGSGARVDGPQVAIGPAGEVYVAWEAIAEDYATREIDIRQSSNHGSSFGDPVKVTDVTRVGSYDALQGMIQAREFPMLAVDTTKGSKKVYIAWNDGRNLYATEAFSTDYKYRFADILFTSSMDGGATWLATPVRVNQNTETYVGSDQFFPALAVDKIGNLGACFYDRRADPNNLFIERYCAFSTDTGNTWAEVKVSSGSSTPLHDQDMLVQAQSIGEYDTLCADKLRKTKTFVGSFGDTSARANWDVVAVRFSF